MQDTAVQRAKARSEVLRKSISAAEAEIARIYGEIERHTEELVKLENFIITWHELAGLEPPTPPQVESNVPSPEVRKRPKNPDRSYVVDRTLEIIQQYGRPMSRREIFDALAARGIRIEGKDAEMVLSTMLWRERHRVTRISGFGYWPADQKYGPAGYDPEMEALLGVGTGEPEDRAQ